MSAIPTEVEEFGAAIAEVVAVVSREHAARPSLGADRTEPPAIAEALTRFVEVAQQADAGLSGGALSPGELSEIGDHGLTLLEGLEGWLGLLALGRERTILDRAVAGVAVWLARRGATVAYLELVVNALARLANQTFDPAELAALSDRMGEVLEAVPASVRADLGDPNPGRPWRVLNINRGIAATRSHDPERMEAAFEALVRNLPGDAARFFREGMGQMEALNYPPHVRAVMERYFRAWSNRTVH